MLCSDCSDLDRHQHAGIFEVRQVQSGYKFSFFGFVVGWSGKKCRIWALIKDVEMRRQPSPHLIQHTYLGFKRLYYIHIYYNTFRGVMLENLSTTTDQFRAKISHSI